MGKKQGDPVRQKGKSPPRQKKYPNLLRGYTGKGVGRKPRIQCTARGTGNPPTQEERRKAKALTVKERKDALYHWANEVTADDGFGQKQRAFLQLLIRGNGKNGWQGVIWISDPADPRYLKCWQKRAKILEDLGAGFSCRTLKRILSDLESRGIILRHQTKKNQYIMQLCPGILGKTKGGHKSRTRGAINPEKGGHKSRHKGGHKSRTRGAINPEKTNFDVIYKKKRFLNIGEKKGESKKERVKKSPAQSAPANVNEKTKNKKRNERKSSDKMNENEQLFDEPIQFIGDARYPNICKDRLAKARDYGADYFKKQQHVVRTVWEMVDAKKDALPFWLHEDRIFLIVHAISRSPKAELKDRLMAVHNSLSSERIIPRKKAVHFLLLEMNAMKSYALEALKQIHAEPQMLWREYHRDGQKRIDHNFEPGQSLIRWIGNEFYLIPQPRIPFK